MTSEQVMLALGAVLAAMFAGGCHVQRDADEIAAPRLVAPYGERQVWAVAPLRNESGSYHADGVKVADQLARQLEQAEGLDTVPVNRVLSAMEALEMPMVASPEDARRLLGVLQVDALVVGTLSTFDPYDPPKLGLAVELYVDPERGHRPPLDARGLSSAAVDERSRLPLQPTGQPVTVVSAVFDAADPATRELLQRYAIGRGVDPEPGARDWRLYRLSMDLYTEFVSYAVSWRLLSAEGRRIRSASPPEPLS